MGQRLVIKINELNDIKRERILATGYFHWSGYTSVAIDCINKIIEARKYQKKHLKKTSEVLEAIYLLSSLRAGLDPEDNEVIREMTGATIDTAYSRDEGIINVIPRSMQNVIAQAEMLITISVDIEYIDISSLFKDFDKSDSIGIRKKLKEKGISPFKGEVKTIVSFSEFKKYAKKVRDIEKNNGGYWELDSELYSVVE